MKSCNLVLQYEFDAHIRKIKKDNNAFFIIFNDNVTIGFGCMRDYIGHVNEIVVGTKCENSDGLIRGRDLTTTLVALYHEIGHARQVRYEFEKQTDLSAVLAVNHFARKSSTSYYDVEHGDDGNYVKQPSEIAAQYYGLNMAYRYLSKNIDPESANTLICDYINNEVNFNFIPVDKNNPYTDVNDIFEKFNDVFNESIYKHRFFDPRSRYETVYNDIGSPKITAMLAAPTTSGLRQDIILTKLFLTKTEEGEHLQQIDFGKRIVKAVQNIDFDKVATPFVGQRHVPAVQRVDLSTILPQVKVAKNDKDRGEYEP